MDQIEDEIRPFSGSIVKTKLTSLAFMRLVPGADRVFRHISIRCMPLCSYAPRLTKNIVELSG